MQANTAPTTGATRKRSAKELPTNRGVSAKEAAAIFGMAPGTFWRLNKERADMPKPVRYGARCTRWSLSELLQWREAQK